MLSSEIYFLIIKAEKKLKTINASTLGKKY